MQCDRHPRAAAHGGLCPACLIEAALASDLADADTARLPAADRTAETRRLTICLPLGATARASVFLVREGAASPRLLRLKVWHAPAAPGFLDRFDDLRIRLERWRGSPIALPLAAFLDPAGCPAVLSEFRQGVQILDAVRTRSIKSGSAWTSIRPVIDVLRAIHAEGLRPRRVGPATCSSNSDPDPRTCWISASPQCLTRHRIPLPGCAPTAMALRPSAAPCALSGAPDPALARL